jgi:NitT/TauT family transport system substrate-binding protein
LANERGYFKQQGLNVEILDFNNSSASMTALLSKGELDVGAGNIVSAHFNAINLGQRFKLVADKGHLEKKKEYIALLVRADHLASGRYKTAKDLKGFKMGLTSLDGVSKQIITERILHDNGLKPNDVEFVKLSYAEMNMALKAKLIDATIQIEPFLTKATLTGIAKNVLSATNIHPTQQSAALFYSQDFIEKNPTEAYKFMIAYLQGIHDYNLAFIEGKEKKEIISSLNKTLNIDDENVWKNMNIVGLNNNGMINEQALKEDMEWYLAKKYITKIPDYKNVVDMHFANEASKSLYKK